MQKSNRNQYHFSTLRNTMGFSRCRNHCVRTYVTQMLHASTSKRSKQYPLRLSQISGTYLEHIRKILLSVRNCYLHCLIFKNDDLDTYITLMHRDMSLCFGVVAVMGVMKSKTIRNTKSRQTRGWITRKSNANQYHFSALENTVDLLTCRNYQMSKCVTRLPHILKDLWYYMCLSQIFGTYLEDLAQDYESLYSQLNIKE